MPKPRSSPKLVPITEGEPFQPDPGLVKLVVFGSRHALDLRTMESYPLPACEVLPFPPAQPETDVEKTVANSASLSDPCRDRNWREQEAKEMKRFHIDPNNRVTVLVGEEPPAQEGSAVFHSERALGNAANGWPLARLTEIWNGLAGVEPVSKFKDRATGVSRIWKQIQTLEAAAPTPTRKVKQAKRDKEAAPVATATDTTAPGTKTARVLGMLRAAEGATLGQIMAATGWQKHSVRGFLSGAVHKKMGFTVLSSKNTNGERTYRLKP